MVCPLFLSFFTLLLYSLVLAKKTLPEMRQLYFKLKEQIFASPRFGFAYNTEALESLLKETLGSEIRMCDVREPKLVIVLYTVLEMFSVCLQSIGGCCKQENNKT